MVVGEQADILFKPITTTEEFRRYVEYFTSHIYIVAYESDNNMMSFNLFKKFIEDKFVSFLNEINDEIITFKSGKMHLTEILDEKIMQQLRDKIEIHLLISMPISMDDING